MLLDCVLLKVLSLTAMHLCRASGTEMPWPTPLRTVNQVETAGLLTEGGAGRADVVRVLQALVLEEVPT
jgi:hypothetical protein